MQNEAHGFRCFQNINIDNSNPEEKASTACQLSMRGIDI